MNTKFSHYKTKQKVKRGDIVRIQNEIIEMGNIQSFDRPYLVISNDVGNYYSNICLCVPLTGQNKKLSQPTHLKISYNNSVLLCEQIHTVQQENIKKVCYHLKDEEMRKVDEVLKISMGVD